MNKILVTGSLGQIGSELVVRLQELYGDKNVIASDVRKTGNGMPDNSIFEVLDVTDGKRFYEIAKKYNVDTIIHLAALLSSVGEQNPQKAWHINMGGLYNALEVEAAGHALFTPSSIAAFGLLPPRTILPKTLFKTGYMGDQGFRELLCDYYHEKYGVDTRGCVFPTYIL